MPFFSPGNQRPQSCQHAWLAALLAASLSACGAPRDAGAQSATNDAAPIESADPATSQSDTATVVFLGDSLTAGYGLSSEDALPEQVQAIWMAKGLDLVAVNAGASGDTTANGLARFDWSVSSVEPELVVVALGSNDFLLGVPADVARGNLSAILEKADAAGIPAVLVGVALRGEVLPGSPEAAYEAIYPEVADEFDVPYYPSLLRDVAANPELLQPDGLHPTKAGVLKIAPPLAEFLAPLATNSSGP